MRKHNIPPEFQQQPENSLIDKCIMCKEDLLAEGRTYLLEKAVRAFPGIEARETIFEYAICLQCAAGAQKKLSHDSRRKIKELFESDEVAANAREIARQLQEEDQASHHFCLLTGKPISQCEEYQLYAYCEGRYLRGDMPTFMLSGEALESIHNMLSVETKDELENFKNENFGLPPELEKLINPKDLIFM